MERFFEIYPDGRLIYIIRNPQSWYSSALRAEPEVYADVKWSVKCWKAGLHSALRTRERFADHTCLIKVEDLLDKTEPVMRHLAQFLGLQYNQSLLTPTFNGYPVSADGSINMTEAAKHHPKDDPNLNKDRLKIITEMTKKDYQTALKEAISV